MLRFNFPSSYNYFFHFALICLSFERFIFSFFYWLSKIHFTNPIRSLKSSTEIEPKMRIREQYMSVIFFCNTNYGKMKYTNQMAPNDFIICSLSLPPYHKMLFITSFLKYAPHQSLLHSICDRFINFTVHMRRLIVLISHIRNPKNEPIVACVHNIFSRKHCAFTFLIFHFKHMKTFVFVPTRLPIACNFVWIQIQMKK